MDGIAPFSEKEQQELRSICQPVFDGANPFDYPETEEIYSKYRLLFEVFFRIIDARYGNYLHYPFNDDAVNQPDKTMKALDIIRDKYREHLKERQEVS